MTEKPMRAGAPAMRQVLLSLSGRPIRIQRKRIRGWRMPADAIYVGRPTLWGNPFTIKAAIETDFANEATAPQFVVDCFRDWLGASRSGRDWWAGPESDRRRKAILDRLGTLRGKNLVCFCRPDRPCHADVLLELANR